MQSLLRDAVENLHVSVAGVLRVSDGSDVFAEVIEASVHTVAVAGTRGDDGVIEVYDDRA